jgi:hypothetical protein
VEADQWARGWGDLGDQWAPVAAVGQDEAVWGRDSPTNRHERPISSPRPTAPAGMGAPQWGSQLDRQVGGAVGMSKTMRGMQQECVAEVVPPYQVAALWPVCSTRALGKIGYTQPRTLLVSPAQLPDHLRGDPGAVVGENLASVAIFPNSLPLAMRAYITRDDNP